MNKLDEIMAKFDQISGHRYLEVAQPLGIITWIFLQPQGNKIQKSDNLRVKSPRGWILCKKLVLVSL